VPAPASALEVPEPQLAPPPRRPYGWLVLIPLALAAWGATSLWRARRTDAAVARETTLRLAVLPLTAVGAADPEAGVGLADLLALRLSLFPGLVVRSTATVLEQTRDQPAQDAIERARVLDADVLVDGSLTHTAAGFDVRLRLLEGRSGRTLWAGEASALAGDLVALEQRLCDELAPALNLPLEQLAIERWAAPTSADVAQTYWRAQALSLRGWRASKEALRLTASVIATDPNFAPAHALRAQVLGLEVGYGVADDPKQNHREALVAAQRAVALDPKNAHARAILGGALADAGELDEGAAQAAAARDAAPSLPSIHMVLGWLYRWAGLLDRAERAYATAFQIDPSLWRAGAHLAYVATLEGDEAKAEATLARLETFGATAETAALEMRAWRRYNLGDWPGAEQACGAIASRPGVLNYCPRLLALLRARRGDLASARELLARHGEDSYPDGRRRFDRAALYAAIGDRRAALTELKAAETYGFQAPQALRFDPDLGPLLEDPDFRALLVSWEERRARREATWR